MEPFRFILWPPWRVPTPSLETYVHFYVIAPNDWFPSDDSFWYQKRVQRSTYMKWLRQSEPSSPKVVYRLRFLRFTLWNINKNRHEKLNFFLRVWKSVFMCGRRSRIRRECVSPATAAPHHFLFHLNTREEDTSLVQSSRLVARRKTSFGETSSGWSSRRGYLACWSSPLCFPRQVRLIRRSKTQTFHFEISRMEDSKIHPLAPVYNSNLNLLY